MNWHRIWATIQKGKLISPVSISVHNLKLHADKFFSRSCSFPGLGTSNWKVEQNIEELLDPLTYKNCSLECNSLNFGHLKESFLGWFIWVFWSDSHIKIFVVGQTYSKNITFLGHFWIVGHTRRDSPLFLAQSPSRWNRVHIKGPEWI